MKKFFAIASMVIMFFTSMNNADAQMLRDTNLEKYAKEQYGKKWLNAADEIGSMNLLSDNGEMVFTKTIEVPGLSKNDLFYEMANWFICNYDHAIELAEKEDGVIIARPYVENIASSCSGFNSYDIAIRPTLRADISDGLVKITYSLNGYNVKEEIGGGIGGAALVCGVAVAAVAADASHNHHGHKETTVIEHYGRHGHHTTIVERTYRPCRHHYVDDALLLACVANCSKQDNGYNTTWSLSNCYPYAAKDSHKKASSKAFVMATTYSQLVMSNIETALDMCLMAEK